MLDNLQRENDAREACHSQTTYLAEADHKQQLLAIKVGGEKTSQEQAKEIANVREEYKRKGEEVLKVSQDLEGQLEAEQNRHREKMKFYPTFQDSM